MTNSPDRQILTYWKVFKYLVYLFAINVLFVDMYYGLKWAEKKYEVWMKRPNIPGEVLSLYEEKSICFGGDNNEKINLKYRLMSPEPLEQKNKYPLIFFLHGAGERGDDNLKQLKYIPSYLASQVRREKYPCFVMAPQCPKEKNWSSDIWCYDSEKKSISGHDYLLKILSIITEDYPVDSERIYLVGYSMGGFGCWSLAALDTELFAAVVPICGGGHTSDAEVLKKIPIWAIHGGADKVVPSEESRKIINAIVNAGGSPNYTELKWGGHDVCKEAFLNTDDVLDWMFQQNKPISSQ